MMNFKTLSPPCCNGHRPSKTHLRVAILIIITIVVHTCGAKESNNDVVCRDDSGNAVDWYIAYKLPKIKGSSNPNIRSGLGYAYILPGSQEWIVSATKGIGNPGSLVGRTLEPIFHVDNGGTEDKLAYILYNDQPPIGPSVDYGGHTKGVILSNSHGGLWLQHSVPHFPSVFNEKGQTINYTYPKTGENNGQVFHCMSLGVDQVDNVGNILQVTKPHVYNSGIPSDLSHLLPTLEKVIGNQESMPNRYYQYQFIDHRDVTHEETERYQYHARSMPILESDVNNKIILMKNGGRTIYSFAKGPSFHEEIYADWIAQNVTSELYVQSWLNGPNAYPSNCTSASTKVYNIEDKTVAGNKFSTHNDHSKWAIATQRPVVCIGDLNRMEHQTQRGGAVNCFIDKLVWKAFKKTVDSTQPCPRSMQNQTKLRSAK